MKNWLRKIAAWLWVTKERMVLAAMVIILCFRVYQVVQPPVPPDPETNFQPPGNKLPLDVKTPGVPPRTPAPPDLENWNNLWRTNPFTYVRPGTRRKVTDEGEDIDLELLNIQKLPGGDRVQIRSATRKGWYKEGDPFESYQLVSIDADAGCIEVFAEEIGRRVPICMDD